MGAVLETIAGGIGMAASAVLIACGCNAYVQLIIGPLWKHFVAVPGCCMDQCSAKVQPALLACILQTEPFQRDLKP